MIQLYVNPNSGVPVYRQVMDQVTHYAASGVLPPDVQLPSIRALARQLAVNPTTIVKAYNELQHKGVITIRQGSGAFVNESPKALTHTQQVALLEPLARQLALTAKQVGGDHPTVTELVDRALLDVGLTARKTTTEYADTMKRTSL